jgi:glucokinase
MAYFLAGDVGGTKTRLAVYEKSSSGIRRLSVVQYKSADYANLETIISLFLASQEQQVDFGCVGVPGPVVNGAVSITNLPWTLSETEIELKTGLKKILLVNDLVATAAALPYLKGEDLMQIKAGEEVPESSLAAVIAPGTGMGMGFLVKNNKGSHILASEGGHAGFAPANDREEKLLRFLRTENAMTTSHICIEDLLCGPGLKNIFDFVVHESGQPAATELVTSFSSADPAAMISQAALNQTDQHCVAALDLFVKILGSHCGNVAVTTVATGGVYLGGGIPPRIASKIDSDLFRNSFLDKGKMKELVNRIPIYLIKDDYAALVGASSLASEIL